MTALVTRLRNIAAAKSRPMDRASCIETEAADAIEHLVWLWTAEASVSELESLRTRLLGEQIEFGDPLGEEIDDAEMAEQMGESSPEAKR